MADETPTNNSEPTSEQPSSEAPSGQVSDSGQPQKWVAGPHSQYAGRSAEELLGIAEAQAAALNRPVQVQVPQQPYSRFDMDMNMNDDDFVDGKRLKAIINRFAQNPNTIDYAARQQAAGALLATIEMRRADDFRRWGTEIRQELLKLDPGVWTLDNLNIVVDIVRSRHIDELAAEKAQRLVNESHPTIRSGSGGSGSGVPYKPMTMDSEGVPREWREAARAQGISEQQVWEFCQMAGITEEQYYKDLVKYGKGGVIHG